MRQRLFRAMWAVPLLLALAAPTAQATTPFAVVRYEAASAEWVFHVDECHDLRVGAYVHHEEILANEGGVPMPGFLPDGAYFNYAVDALCTGYSMSWGGGVGEFTLDSHLQGASAHFSGVLSGQSSEAVPYEIDAAINVTWSAVTPAGGLPSWMPGFNAYGLAKPATLSGTVVIDGRSLNPQDADLVRYSYVTKALWHCDGSMCL